MTPLNLILWALAIGGAWLILSFCILIERWINFQMESLTQRRIGHASVDLDHRNGSGDRSNQPVAVSPDKESDEASTGDRS